MKPNIRITAARLAALLVLAALLCEGVQAAMAAEEQTLTIAVGTAAGTPIGDSFGTDPTLYKDIMPGFAGKQDYHIYTHFSPLITLDGDANIIPWMAGSYEISDDCKTITFHLRKDVRFADGTPLNASVLKFNFDRLMTYGYAGKYNTAKLPSIEYYDDSEALDEYTFKICFNQGWAEMPFDMSRPQYGYFISPLDVDPAWDIKGILKQDKKYNGLGPYCVEENESIPNEKVVLKKRSSWRDDLGFHQPKPEKIVLVSIANPQTAVMALEKGEIDYICRYNNAPLDALLKLEINPKITIKTKPETRMYFISTAYWKEPFNGTDGISLRKAICYALNRSEIVKGVFYGYAIPATDSMGLSPLRTDVPECCHKGYDYDLEKAKQLLSEAGWNDSDGDGILDRDNKALKNINLVIISPADLPWQEDVAMIVQSQLKRIGIDVEIQPLEYSAYVKAKSEGDFDLLMTYNMGRGFSSSQEIKWFNMNTLYGSRNYYSNQNGSLETAVTNAQKAVSKEERDQSFCQACNMLYEDAGIMPLVYEMQYAVMSSRVKGFEFGPSMNWFLAVLSGYGVRFNNIIS